jgi:hypothetical protein
MQRMQEHAGAVPRRLYAQKNCLTGAQRCFPLFGQTPTSTRNKRMEHDEIEGSLERLQEVQDLAEAKNLLLHAIQTARVHFAKEEQVLITMAAQMLNANTINQLGTKWAELRKVTV